MISFQLIFQLAVAFFLIASLLLLARSWLKYRRQKQTAHIAESEWTRTFDSISDGILIIDNRHIIVRANKGAHELFKNRTAPLIGSKCYEIIHKMSEPWPECPLEKSRADKKPHTEEMASPATDVPLLISTSPILDKSGEYLGVVYVAKDISRQKKTLTDLVETKKKLEEAMRIRSEFTSMVSHELRTPLTAIREGISLVLSKKTGPITDEQSELLSLAKTNVDRLTRLINDILDFQCLDSGKMTFSMEEYDISVVLEEVWRSMAPAAQEKGLAFHLHVQPDLPILRFDRDRIVQVVTNLINNAVKFTSRGSVTIRVFRGDNNIEVSIEDTGPGIAESDIPKLFHKFSQLESGTERKIGSSGLGLAICRQIIEAHRGKVKVKSELGRGSTFCFLLPIHERRG